MPRSTVGADLVETGKDSDREISVGRANATGY